MNQLYDKLRSDPSKLMMEANEDLLVELNDESITLYEIFVLPLILNVTNTKGFPCFIKIFEECIERFFNLSNPEVDVEKIVPLAYLNKRLLKKFRICSQTMLRERCRYIEFQHDLVIPSPISIGITNDERELLGRRVMIIDRVKVNEIKSYKYDLYSQTISYINNRRFKFKVSRILPFK